MQSVMRAGTRAAQIFLKRRLQHTLIVGEMAFALALLTGAGLFLRGMERFAQRDPGWRVDGLIMGQLILQGDKYATSAGRGAFYQRLEERLGALPGVQQVALSQSPPVRGCYSSGGVSIEGPPELKLGQSLSFVQAARTRYRAPFAVRLLGVPAVTA